MPRPATETATACLTALDRHGVVLKDLQKFELEPAREIVEVAIGEQVIEHRAHGVEVGARVERRRSSR